MIDELKIFSGQSHPTLAEDICQYLKVPLGKVESFKFSNDNTFVKILESVREDDVFVVQPGAAPVNDGIMELLIMIDALKRASARRITAVLPYFPYCRSEKKDQPRVAISARLMADLLTAAGANRILTMELHSPAIMGFFNIPVDHLTAEPILVEYMKQFSENLVVVSPDAGGAKRARNFARKLHSPMALIDKRRVGNDEMVEVENVVGDVESKDCLIVDEEILSGSTIVQGALALKRNGASRIFVAVTHAVLSGSAVAKLDASPVDQVVVTNTLPIGPEKLSPKIKALSVAALFAKTIARIHSGDSVGSMFKAED